MENQPGWRRALSRQHETECSPGQSLFPRLSSRAVPLARSGLVAVTLLVGCAVAAALKSTDHFGLRDLERESPLTPRQFSNLFGDFRYEYSPYVQPVDRFLEDRIGDCDDYALLADHILSGKGYRTRFIQISFAGSDVAHAVCYVVENKAYLDYNNRKYEVKLERAGAALREIATKVADAFEKNWTSVTEYSFSYETYRKSPRYTVVKTDSPRQDPDLQSISSP